jgi:hypothetical protein
MNKYGWFKTGGSIPSVAYDADYMQMEKEYVQLYRFGGADDPPGRNHLVAAIRLDKGQDVRMIDKK